MPGKVVGLFCIAMDQETKEYIILLALDNLINVYKDALETVQFKPEEKDLAQQIIEAAEIIKSEYIKPNQIPRPQWKKSP